VNAQPDVFRRRIKPGTNGKYPAGHKSPPKAETTGGIAEVSAELLPWLRTQALNVTRHAAALRPFRRDEFGLQAPAPTEAHIQAANNLIKTLREDLLRVTQKVRGATEVASEDPTSAHLSQMLRYKERAHDWVRAVERVWDFYFELFGQRQSRFGEWLLGCDRIALDCYQAAYRGVGTPKSVPTPPPFAYMRTGFSPATFRRSIPLRRLGQQLNPFPLIQLPYHRLTNPWTLGAVLHEVSHNLQNDLGLARAVPTRMARQLLEAGYPHQVAMQWTRWNRELFADVCGLLLGGPTIVASLMDVLGRSPQTVMTFSPRGPHPTPYLRTFISIEVLRRMGFTTESDVYRRTWEKLYPNPRAGNIPRRLLDSFGGVNELVVDAVCFQPFTELGNRSLAQTMRFERKDDHMIEEAARRLASGVDPGIIPERFLIGAARLALDLQLARPGVITENFYKELARR
jgi:hypothetical protein